MTSNGWMRTRSILPADCARACQQLSLRMDSELSEFELVLLDAHLRRCPDCRAFGESITGVTNALRSVPLERPSLSFQPLRARTRFDTLVTGALRAGSAAAAIAVVAITGLIAFNGSNSAIPESDLAKIRGVLDLHERQLQALDRYSGAPAPQVPRGLVAAERVALRSATSSRRLQGRR
jgi:predicted anti-sigma-YlaC factor YlaD